MKKTLILLLFLLLSVNCFAATTYYMRADGTKGSKGTTACNSGSASDFMDVEDFNGESFSSGDTVVLCDDGNDYDSISFELDSDHAGITIQPESGVQVTIHLSGVAMDFNAGADNITIDGNDSDMPYGASPNLSIIGGGDRVVGIYSDYVTIKQVYVAHDTDDTGNTAVEVKSSSVDHVTIENCKIEDTASYLAAAMTSRDGFNDPYGCDGTITIKGNYFKNWGHTAIGTTTGTDGPIYIYWNEIYNPDRAYGRAFGVKFDSGYVYVFENWIHNVATGSHISNMGSGTAGYGYNNLFTDFLACCDNDYSSGTCAARDNYDDWAGGCDNKNFAIYNVDYGLDESGNNVFWWHNTFKNIAEGVYESGNSAADAFEAYTYQFSNNVADDVYQEDDQQSEGNRWTDMNFCLKNSDGNQTWSVTIQNNIFEDAPHATYDVFFDPEDDANDDYVLPTSENDNDSTPTDNWNYADVSDHTDCSIDDNYKTTLSLDSHGEPSAGSPVVDYGQTGLTVTGAPEIASVTHGVNLGIKPSCIDYDTFALTIGDCMANRDSNPDVGAFEIISGGEISGVSINP